MKIVISAASAFILSFAAPAFAQPTLAYVEVERLVFESKQGRALLTRIELEAADAERELMMLQGLIVDIRNRLAVGAGRLSPRRLARIQGELDRLVEERTVRTASEEARLETLRNEELRALEILLLAAIEEIRQAQAVEVIFGASGSGLVAADPAYDLTDIVIAYLDNL